MSSVPKKADKLNFSLSINPTYHQAMGVECKFNVWHNGGLEQDLSFYPANTLEILHLGIDIIGVLRRKGNIDNHKLRIKFGFQHTFSYIIGQYWYTQNTKGWQQLNINLNVYNKKRAGDFKDIHSIECF